LKWCAGEAPTQVFWLGDRNREQRNRRNRAVSRLALSFKEEPALSPISPRRELGAYEALFLEEGATFKKLADRFKKDSEALPSDFVAPEHADRCAQAAIEELLKSGIQKFGVRINRAAD